MPGAGQSCRFRSALSMSGQGGKAEIQTDPLPKARGG